MNIFKKPRGLRHFADKVMRVLAIVLIWRGLWYVLDYLDAAIFGDGHFWMSFLSIGLGLVILYFPDRNLDDLV